MPKQKKPQSDSGSSSDSDSGPEDKNPTKKAKTGPSTAKVLKNKEGESYWEIDRQRRVTVREFKNRVFVDIREFYEKDGKNLPGKRGISMSTTQWQTLKGLIDEIDDAVRDIA